jgi:hypothetical protein
LVLSLCEHYITLDDITQLDGARADPKRFIQDLPRPIVIDEIQKAPELLPAIKEEVDRKRKNGDFLLTGSANLLGYKKVTESLAGRMGVMELLPLSCREMANRADANLADDLFLQNGQIIRHLRVVIYYLIVFCRAVIRSCKGFTLNGEGISGLVVM